MKQPIVSLPELLQSTRDAGYLSPAHAVAELIDNAIQAGARRVDVEVADGPGGITLSVRDDGCGMDAETLASALRLGGSSRFGDRAGLGRFGMGLPSSSLSQARRVEVESRRAGAPAWRAHLDLDEVVRGVGELEVSGAAGQELGVHGTVVRWTRCDRLEGSSARRVGRELRAKLGRIFRRFIWDGLTLTVNGEACPPVDPLFVDPRAPLHGARLFCEPVELPVATSLGEGTVIVRFAELPIDAWHPWSVAEKRRAGVTAAAGVSVVRAGREVDQAWLFMGDKKRESYDAWWRCEVEFEPPLDEAFGLTYTKQQVRPCPELVEALTQVISPVAYALNARARSAHRTIAARARFSPIERRAANVEARLPPLRDDARGVGDDGLLQRLVGAYPELGQAAVRPELRLVEEDLGAGPLVGVARSGARLVVALNRSHPFYEQAYAPLASSVEPGAAERRAQLELLFVSLARAEAAAHDDPGPHRAFRARWGGVLAELLRG